MMMNEYDIERAVEMTERHLPEAAPYARFLSDWKDVVNSNSDGWPYWTPARKAAARLMDCVSQAMDSLRDPQKTVPTEAEFRKALTPIRSFATTKKLPAPELQKVAAPEPEDFEGSEPGTAPRRTI